MVTARKTVTGFTLIEATIALAVIALAAAVMIPALAGMGRAHLRQAAAYMVGTVKATYDNAALSGETYRLVFTFEPPVVKVEKTKQPFAFDSTEGAVASVGKHKDDSAPAGKLGMSFPEETKKEDAKADLANNPLLALLQINDKADVADKQSTFSSAGKDLKLGDGIRLMDVWIEGMDQVASEGEIYLYFFPNGYTQDALIHLGDHEGRAFTVKVSALSGKAEVIDKYEEVPK